MAREVAIKRNVCAKDRAVFTVGDGTGAGKGRQVAGILLDNWLKGRRRAVWVSKSDKLIEDAQRDWSALGQERLLVTPLSRFRQGTPIRLPEGILFTTYATLRSDARDEKASRVKQIVDWLGCDFDGVIVFDESHAMQNAAGGAHLAAILFPVTLRRLYIVRDDDAAGDGAAASLIDRAKALGIEAITLSPTLEDFNDDLRGRGVDALRTAIRAQLAPEDVARFMELPA